MFSPRDKETHLPRGFTFCQYRRREDAEDAVKGMDKRVGTITHTKLTVPEVLLNILNKSIMKYFDITFCCLIRDVLYTTIGWCGQGETPVLTLPCSFVFKSLLTLEVLVFHQMGHPC